MDGDFRKANISEELDPEEEEDEGSDPAPQNNDSASNNDTTQQDDTIHLNLSDEEETFMDDPEQMDIGMTFFHCKVASLETANPTSFRSR